MLEMPKARVRLTAHSTNISNVVLLGYQHLSDGAKLTYMVLESYDWPDENGLSKGKCWPTIESLATARGKSYDSIARHLKELETAGLIRIESGQERGVANRYWIMEPSVQENNAYMSRFNKKAKPVEEEPLPQACSTASRENAVPGSAKFQEKESNPTQESKIKKDSNLFHAPACTKTPPVPSVAPKSSQSVYLSRLMDDFSRLFNDQPHSASNRTQVNNLYSSSNLTENDFIKLLYEAKKRTQWAALATATTGCNGPNRAAYFFQVLRDLLHQRSTTASPKVSTFSKAIFGEAVLL